MGPARIGRKPYCVGRQAGLPAADARAATARYRPWLPQAGKDRGQANKAVPVHPQIPAAAQPSVRLFVKTASLQGCQFICRAGRQTGSNAGRRRLSAMVSAPVLAASFTLLESAGSQQTPIPPRRGGWTPARSDGGRVGAPLHTVIAAVHPTRLASLADLPLGEVLDRVSRSALWGEVKTRLHRSHRNTF